MNSANRYNEPIDKEDQKLVDPVDNKMSRAVRIEALKKEKHNVLLSALKEGGITALKAAGIFLPGVLYSFTLYPFVFPKNSKDLPRDTKFILIDWAKWTGITMAALGIGGAVGEIHEQISYNKEIDKDIERLIQEGREQERATVGAATNFRHTDGLDKQRAAKTSAPETSFR